MAAGDAFSIRCLEHDGHPPPDLLEKVEAAFQRLARDLEDESLQARGCGSAPALARVVPIRTLRCC
jgi:hypothetical protein